MDNECYIETNGLEGGVALWWKKKVDVVIHRREESMIDTSIKRSNGDGIINITWIYGIKNLDDRLVLWEKI